MDEFLSFFGVIALWVAVSYAAWWVYRRAKGVTEQQRIALARLAEGKVGEAQAVLDGIRTGPAPNAGDRDLTKETHALLRRIQEGDAFFEDVKALRQRIIHKLGGECEPLAEILHIRRDLWAASEILLVEDFRALGPDFPESEFARMRSEAVGLLFRANHRAAGEDLIDLRLALAREEAGKFIAEMEETIRRLRELERMPTAAEVIAYPVAAARAMPRHIRSTRDGLIAFHAQVKALAATIQNSETVARGLSELARARAELPQRVAAGVDKASHAARQGAVSLKSHATHLKGHYEFLAKAHDFQAKYEAALRKTPELTERGKQFITRLELAEKSERLKQTSLTVSDALKRALLRGLAHSVAGLQRLQAALEAQLAQRGATVKKKAAASAVRRRRAGATAKAKFAGSRKPAMAASPAPARTRPASKPATVNRAATQNAEAPIRRPEKSALDTAAPLESNAAHTVKPIPPAVILAPVLKAVKPRPFEDVVAWYQPAITLMHAPKPAPMTVEPAIPLAMAVTPVTPEVAARSADKRKGGRSWWKSLIGGDETTAKAPPTPVVVKKAPRATATDASVVSVKASRPQAGAKAPSPAVTAVSLPPKPKAVVPVAAPAARPKPGFSARATGVPANDPGSPKNRNGEPEPAFASTEGANRQARAFSWLRR